MASALDVAEYMIIRSMKEAGEDPITNLKVQKLCYYAQGIYSNITKGKKLFKENIEAWQHGPVIRDVYLKYSKRRSGILKSNLDYDDLKLSKKEKEVLDFVYMNYSQYSAWRLREMTHNEAPWKNNFVYGKKQIIPFEDIRDYFDRYVKIV